MLKLPNASLDKGSPLSKQFLEMGISTYHDAVRFVQHLPYGRNSSKVALETVLLEKKGTCSTKHALLAQLARENEILGVDLMLGIYRMQESNTRGVGAVLEAHDLSYLPEAHNYLRFEGLRFDFTKPSSNKLLFEPALEEELMILPAQIGTFKVDYHQAFLADWLTKSGLAAKYTLDAIWKIREACIQAL